MPEAPVMIELGAYWAHYSMWLKSVRPQARVVMVEPDREHIAVGGANFQRNGYRVFDHIDRTTAREHLAVQRR